MALRGELRNANPEVIDRPNPRLEPAAKPGPSCPTKLESQNPQTIAAPLMPVRTGQFPDDRSHELLGVPE